MTLVVGDCRETLARWAATGVRVQCVVTSPPYWGLRDYGTAPLVWGGEADCPHKWDEEKLKAEATGSVHWQHTEGGGQPDGSFRNRHANAGVSADTARVFQQVTRGTCARCGAWRGALGLEPTPELYVAHLVAVFRLVRDVLADDGTLWLNLGDSYASGEIGRHDGYNPTRANGSTTQKPFGDRRQTRPNTGLKPKDLVGIPWRVAFALQADGWYLRSDIIWAKPNPMPESVTDRPTKAHEYLFLLTKRERYYYDAEAIREPHADDWHARASTWRNGDAKQPQRGATYHPFGVARPFENPPNPAGRNRRSVWTIATAPYPEAHFATFPPDLVTPCILAGSRPGDTVLDPFMGSGTVAMVAQDLGRAWLGGELNPAYAALCEQRTRQQGLVLTPLTPDG